MLVLSRRLNETIRIGDEICIRVVGVGPDTVRLGIEAPPHVSVHRGEVYERIQRENMAAAHAPLIAMERAASLIRKQDASDAQKPPRKGESHSES